MYVKSSNQGHSFKNFLSQNKNNSPPLSVTSIKTVWSESKNGVKVSISYWLIIWASYSFFESNYSFQIKCQLVKFDQLPVNLHKIVIFSVSNDGIQQPQPFYDVIQNEMRISTLYRE